MTAQNFPTVLAETLSHEGRWADHPKDPGGATMKGITIGTFAAWKRRPVTKTELRNISDADVTAIYRQNYWNKVRGDDLPAGMDMVGFDGAVNSGVSRGARWLQTGLGVAADGAIGAKTLAAARAAKNPVSVIQKACAARMGFLRGLRTFSTFGRGWMRRVASVEATAVAMATKSADVLLTQAKKTGTAAKNQASSAAGSAGVGAGGSYGLDGLPDFATYGLLAVALIAAVVLVSKSRVSRARAKAYAAKAVEMLT